MTVHFNQNSMATIIQFKEKADIPGGQNHHRHKSITYNDGCYLKNETFYKFKESKSVLYFYDTSNEDE